MARKQNTRNTVVGNGNYGAKPSGSDKLGQACHTAKTRRNISDNQSHSNVWKLIDDMDI